MKDFTSRGKRASADAVISVLRVVITQHLHAIQLRSGPGLLVSNSRWLHGRDRYTPHPG